MCHTVDGTQNVSPALSHGFRSRFLGQLVNSSTPSLATTRRDTSCPVGRLCVENRVKLNDMTAIAHSNIVHYSDSYSSYMQLLYFFLDPRFIISKACSKHDMLMIRCSKNCVNRKVLGSCMVSWCCLDPERTSNFLRIFAPHKCYLVS